MPKTPDQVYEEIKELEHTFPIPQPTESIDIGTLDCGTGRFSGLVDISFSVPLVDMFPQGYPGNRSWYEGDWWIDRRRRGKFVDFHRVPAPTIAAVHAMLSFGIASPDPPGSGWEVTVNGKTTTVPAGSDTVTVNVEDATSVEWSVMHGSKHAEGLLFLRHSLTAGAGAFRIPVIPLLVLYEPPCDRRKLSAATFTSERSFSTRLETEIQTEESRTRPAKPQGYQQSQTAQDTLNTLAGLFDHANDAVAGAFRAIASGLGNMKATETVGRIDAHGESVETTVSHTVIHSTGPPNDGGPGIGDIIYYLSDVPVLWYALNGNLTLVPLGSGTFHKHSVTYIKDHVEPDIAKVLLELDPFVEGGPYAVLPPPRFELLQPYNVSGQGDCHAEVKSETVTETSWTSETTYTLRVEHYRPGWLSFLGLGVQEEETVTMKTTQSTRIETETEKEDAVAFSLCSEFPDEWYAVDLYRDTLFGTFAFRPWFLTEGAFVSGQVFSEVGGPAAKIRVSLKIGGRSYVVLTDREGRFEFHSPWIAPGAGELVVGRQVRAPIRLRPGVPLRGLELRLPG